MLPKVYSKNQLRDYSSLFSRSAAQLWLKNDFSSINCRIERYDKHWHNSTSATYIDYLKHIYRLLESNYQNEYVFKNSFLNTWLIKEVGEYKTKVFNEYRIGNAIADLVIFNGNSKAFEIKTEYDSNYRLDLQLESYRKVFDQIFIIIPESKLSLYKNLNKSIGIIIFNVFRKKFTLYRMALNNTEINVDVIMRILHTHEYKAIVKSYYGYLPKMNSFNQFYKCWQLINKLPNEELNRRFIEQMKNRSLENIFSYRYYKEFNQLSLALKLNRTERRDMINKLKTPINF